MTRAALLALAFVVGCATTPHPWARDGATRQDFAMDNGQCKAQAFSLSPNAPVLQAAIVYNACMQGKGWERK